MSHKSWKRAHGQSVRAQSEDEQAADFFSPQQERKRERKTRQLCRQVFRTVTAALAGECGDELLRDLSVASVEPWPDAARLVVRVYGPAGVGVCVPEIFERLERVRGRLRHAVACAIVRKRAPELVFMVVAGVDFEREVQP